MVSIKQPGNLWTKFVVCLVQFLALLLRPQHEVGDQLVKLMSASFASVDAGYVVVLLILCSLL